MTTRSLLPRLKAEAPSCRQVSTLARARPRPPTVRAEMSNTRASRLAALGVVRVIVVSRVGEDGWGRQIGYSIEVAGAKAIRARGWRMGGQMTDDEGQRTEAKTSRRGST